MRVAACVACALLVAPTAGAAGRTSLAITVWPKGKPGPSVAWTLRCGPAGGTLPDAGDACRRLSALRDPFAPVPDNAACVQVYGGPQVAFVRGTYRGRRIWTWFQRRDGCETARWKRVSFLFVTQR